MLKAVIFDFDGVISNSEPCHFAAANKVLQDFGIQLSEENYYAQFLGYSDYEMFEAIKQSYKTDFKGLSIEKLIERKAVFFEKAIRDAEHLIEGIPQFVEKLKKNNIKIAIYSGATANDIKLMLEDSGIAEYFEYIVTADDVTKGKPDPQGYLLALKKLQSNSDATIFANQCIVIEDSRWGIIAAKNAGMKVIAVTNSYPAAQLQDADLIIDSVSKLKIEDIQKLCI